MLNFDYCNPVKIVFGEGTISELANLLPANEKIMMLYGGGSIKRNGVYDQIKEALKDRNLVEFSGIEPNPLFETCMKAVEIIKSEGVTFLLAVGGGSVIDATKFIALAAKYQGEDMWEIVSNNEMGDALEDALPLGTVLTLPATGSEMNYNAVISRAETDEKLAMHNPIVYPKFSILDPSTTFTLPERQSANGVVDAFVHVMEQYMTFNVNSPLQDRQSEAILATLMEEGPKVMKDPENYETRANIMWCATHALNGMIACGLPQDWGTHMIGHEITAFYGLDHAQSLAIVLPSLWRNKKEQKKEKLLQFGRRLLGISIENEDAAIDETINKTAAFFNSLGVPTSLSDYNIDAKEAAEKVRDRFNARGVAFGEHADITGDAAFEILLGCK